MPELPPDDPIKTRPLANLVLIAAFLLLLTVAWALYQEFVGLRPWRAYQRRFASVYSVYLRKQIAARQAAEKQVYGSPDYRKLAAALASAEAAAKPGDAEIEKQIALVEAQRASILKDFQTARSLVGSLVYDYEVVPATPEYRRKKQSRLKEVLAAKSEKYAINWPAANGKIVKREMTFDELNNEFTDLLNEKADLTEKEGLNDKPIKDAQEAIDDYTHRKLYGLNAKALQGLLNTVESWDVKLIQINVNPPGNSINDLGGVGLTDRCQSCHLGDAPTFVPLDMVVTKAGLGLPNSHDAPFTSHPEPDLLKIHPLERFGCSPCHGGNGRALDTVTKAHGRYTDWLWPLYFPENYEAGCQQCHSADAWTDHAPALTRAKQLYRERGCIGCHKFQGFDDEADQLATTLRTIQSLEATKKENGLKIAEFNKEGDEAPTNAAAQRFYQAAINLVVTNSKIDAQAEQLDELSHSLQMEVKRVGPDLKEVRMKLNRDWIPYWLEHTWEFRPGTKMPQFRLRPDEVKAIAAFIWQDGLKGPPLEKQPPGDPVKGKQLFLNKGCLACHSIGEGSQKIGGDFAANLSRIGEKENYDYLVRWIHNPRQRTRPYCPYEKRDLGPEDYAKHGLPFVFDVNHSRCPNDGHELIVEQQTVMPSLRLSWAEARDLASFLMTQKHAGTKYAPADYMDAPSLEAEGEALVKHYGCAGCHEIRGLEDEQRVGTELTQEGSKPIERFDFALLRTDAMQGILPDGKKSPRGPWYDLKGFFDEKLANPAIFDVGLYKPNPMDRLRMPKPDLTQDDRNALTTMLLGSVESTLPPSYMYKPSDQRRYIQEGWWIVTKYNCIGCHEVAIGQNTVLETLPQYQAENKINLPPVLTSEGARVNPEWLKRFLANPALSAADTDRNGVRSYLQVRMPTFFLSEDEIRKLVLFFEAMSSQAEPFIPPKLEPLTPAERLIARGIFTSPAAPCLKCHATGNPVHDKTATAPNFLLVSQRLRPAWTKRWITEPASIIPGTAMPSGLFKWVNGRWVFNGPLPPAAQNYKGDEADLLVRYLFELTPQEQGRLAGRTPAPKSARSFGARRAAPALATPLH